MQWTDRIERRLKLRDLHILMVVAQSGSMAKAARELAISQPVVSKTILEMEHALGVRLFDRTPQGAEPTIYGRALLKRSVGIFDELKQSVKELEFLADPAKGEVRVGSTDALGPGLLFVIMKQMSREYPHVAFRITIAESLVLYTRALRERKLDLVIGLLPTPNSEDFDTELLLTEKLHVVVGSNSSWARRRHVCLSELVNAPWVLVPPEHPGDLGSLMADAFRDSGLEVPRAHVLTSSLVIRYGLLADGRYLTILPGSLLRFGPYRSSLKALSVDLPIPPQSVGIVTLKNRSLSPVAQLFIEAARAIVKPLAAKPPGRSPRQSVIK
jgi:DNA-binding transcriptional LysR family regulator